MKRTKMSLENIQGKLSRAEMKNIMAGSGTTCASGGCSVYDSNSHITYYGHCGWEMAGGMVPWCECVTSAGFYFPNGGSSHCAS